MTTQIKRIYHFIENNLNTSTGMIKKIPVAWAGIGAGLGTACGAYAGYLCSFSRLSYKETPSITLALGALITLGTFQLSGHLGRTVQGHVEKHHLSLFNNPQAAQVHGQRALFATTATLDLAALTAGIATYNKLLEGVL